VGFNAIGMATKGSCEGHLDHGTKWPWIDLHSREVEDRTVHAFLVDLAADTGVVLKAERWEGTVRLSPRSAPAVLERADQTGTELEVNRLAEWQADLPYVATWLYWKALGSCGVERTPTGRTTSRAL
jgi:hypothetical protein